MSYPPDPGGVFDSDTHRRVLGHLRQDDHQELHDLGVRVSADPYHDLKSVHDLEEVLKDLEADGYASQSADGWKVTKKGFEALTGPAAETGGAPQPALLDGLEVNGRAS